MKSLDLSKLISVNVVAGVVIIENSKVLLVQEAYELFRGQWNLPAGMVDLGETIEDAAVREAKEEAGLDVEIIQHLQVLHVAADRPVIHSYLARRIGGKIQFDPDEIMDVRWFSFDDIKTMKNLRNNQNIRGAVEKARRYMARKE